MSKKTVRIGLVGVGRLGYQHAYNLANRVPGAELLALCALDIPRLDQVAEELAVPYKYSDFAEMCANPELDAIVIASPSAFHSEQVKIALDAGKHVFTDKPLDTTVEKCKLAERAVEAHPDKIFMLGFMRRYDYSYKLAKEKIERGDIGRIILIRSYSQDPIKLIDGAIAYGPHSGGQFLDMCIHDIDLCRWYTGGKKLKKVLALGGCYEFEQYRDWNDGDNVGALLQFEDDTMAFLFAGRAAPHGYNIETEIIGTRGTLRIGAVGTYSLLEVISEHGVCRECYPNFITRFADAFIAEMIEFTRCIQDGRQPGITVYDGTAATEIAYQCKESFETGKFLSF